MKTWFILVMYTMVIFQPVLSQKGKQNALMPNSLVINDIISLDSNFYNNFGFAKDFYKQAYFKIFPKSAESLNKIIVDKLLSGCCVLYKDSYSDDNLIAKGTPNANDSIPKEDLMQAMGLRKEIRMEENDSGVFIDNDFIILPDADEFKGIVFYDKWLLDEQSFRFYKDVVAYSLIRRYNREIDGETDEFIYKKIGFLIFTEFKKRTHQKALEKKLKPVGRIEYEFSINQNEHFYSDSDLALYTENLNSPFWTSYGRSKLRNILINRAISGKSEAFDYISGKKLDTLQIQERLGVGKTEVVIEDAETGKEKVIEVKNEINPEEIKSVIFIEDWFIDESTLRIVKKVIGIAPVRYIQKTEPEGVFDKKIVFIMYFNQ